MSMVQVSPLMDHQTVLTYDWLVFDLDHALCRYRLPAFLPFVHRIISQFLVEQCHFNPKLVAVPYDPDFAVKGLVYDREFGNLIKIAADGHVHAATHGTRSISQQEIATIYPDALHGVESQPERFIVTWTFFECSLGSLLSNIVDLIDENSLVQPGHEIDDRYSGPDKYSAFLAAIFTAFEHHYGHYDRGEYFKEFRASISTFVYERPEVAAWLRDMSAKSKLGKAPRLMLLTNSRLDYTNLLCSYILGSDWKSVFDLIVVDSKKPSFFDPQVKRSFFAVDLATAQCKLETVVELKTSSSSGSNIVAHGNSEELNLYMTTITGREQIKVCFFEDNLETGILAARNATNWHNCGVVEELDQQRLSDKPTEFFVPRISRKFGSLLLCDKDHSLDSDVPAVEVEQRKLQVAKSSYWQTIINGRCQYTLPCLSQLAEQWRQYSRTH